jgi:hypothetical protein
VRIVEMGEGRRIWNMEERGDGRCEARVCRGLGFMRQ